jgi:hypothetical protein
MLAAILAFAIAIVTALSHGNGDAPGLTNPSLPVQAGAEQHSNAETALAESGRPATVPADNAAGENGTGGDSTRAPEDVPVGGGQVNQPEQPTVDTSNAPEAIDLGDVPAQENENANVPDTVGANEHADLPEQAGGDAGGNGGNDVSQCAKGAGKAASECSGQ